MGEPFGGRPAARHEVVADLALQLLRSWQDQVGEALEVGRLPVIEAQVGTDVGPHHRMESRRVVAAQALQARAPLARRVGRAAPAATLPSGMHRPASQESEAKPGRDQAGAAEAVAGG